MPLFVFLIAPGFGGSEEKMNLAIIGATGLVGEEILKVLKERNIFITNLILVASKKSQGKTISFLNTDYKIISIENALEKYWLCPC